MERLFRPENGRSYALELSIFRAYNYLSTPWRAQTLGAVLTTGVSSRLREGSFTGTVAGWSPRCRENKMTLAEHGTPRQDEVEHSAGELEAPSGHGREIKLHIYIYPRDGRWYAECAELTLMGEGTSSQEAVSCLLEQARLYVKTIVEHGWLDRLVRPISLRRRAEIYARMAIAGLRRRRPTISTRPLYY